MIYRLRFLPSMSRLLSSSYERSYEKERGIEDQTITLIKLRGNMLNFIMLRKFNLRKKVNQQKINLKLSVYAATNTTKQPDIERQLQLNYFLGGSTTLRKLCINEKVYYCTVEMLPVTLSRDKRQPSARSKSL